MLDLSMYRIKLWKVQSSGLHICIDCTLEWVWVTKKNHRSLMEKMLVKFRCMAERCKESYTICCDESLEREKKYHDDCYFCMIDISKYRKLREENPFHIQPSIIYCTCSTLWYFTDSTASRKCKYIDPKFFSKESILKYSKHLGIFSSNMITWSVN